MSSDNAKISPAQHYGGFVIAGLAALGVDALVLFALVDGLAVSPYTARLISISAAMIVSWQVNRRVTFAVVGPATVTEFGKFAAVSWVAQAVNYAVFAGILLLWPGTWLIAALIAASGVAMFVSYAGFRFGVFRKD